MPAVAGSRPRGRGRAPKLGQMPGGTLPKNPQGVPKRGPGGMLPQRGGKVNPPGTGMMNPPGQGPARASRGRGAGGKGGPGVGGSKNLTLGPQLAARVSSGKITKEQAQRTLQQRHTLAKALGSNWRDKLQVGGKSFAQVNAGLKKSPDNAKLAALRKKLIGNRSSVLETARKKNKGGKKGGVPGESED